MNESLKSNYFKLHNLQEMKLSDIAYYVYENKRMHQRHQQSHCIL